MPEESLKAIVRKCELFSNASEDMITDIVSRGQQREFVAGSQVICAGEVSNSMYVVCSGLISCQVGGKEVKQIVPGQTFGELAIYYDHICSVFQEHKSIIGDSGPLEKILQRTADIFVLSTSVLLEILREDLVHLLRQHPRLDYNFVKVTESQIEEACAHNSKEAQNAKAIILMLHPLILAGFMKGVPSSQVRAIIEAVPTERRLVRRLEPLVLQGSDGDSVFLVMGGLFSCQVNGREVRQFGPWQLFGEVSLCASFPELVLRCLPDKKDLDRVAQAVSGCCVRTADVLCIEEGHVIEIQAEHMANAFRLSDQVFANVFAKAEERFLEAVSYGSVDAILRFQGPGEWEKEAEDHFSLFVAFDAVKACPLFAKTDREKLLAVVRKGQRRDVSEGKLVVCAGDAAGEDTCSVFIVCSGRLSCQVAGKEVKQLLPGRSFGELAVHFNLVCSALREHAQEVLGEAGPPERILKRTADVVAVENSVLLELSLADMLSFFEMYPRLFCNFMRVAELQMEEACLNMSIQAQDARSVLDKLHPFIATGIVKGVPSSELSSILDAVEVEPQHIKRFQPLSLQGSKEDSIFLVIGGLFSCQVNGKEVRQFGPWSTFGDISLCASFPELVNECLPKDKQFGRLPQAVSGCCARTADILCLEEGQVIELQSHKMKEIFKLSHQVYQNVFSLAEERFLEAVASGSLDAIIRYQG